MKIATVKSIFSWIWAIEISPAGCHAFSPASRRTSSRNGSEIQKFASHWRASTTSFICGKTPSAFARNKSARRKLGSVTSPNRSSNRRSPSSTAQRCSFVWIPSTRGHASTATDPGAPVFTGDLPAFQSFHRDPAVALRNAPSFPRFGLIRRLRPASTLPADDVPARPKGGMRRNGSHVHHRIDQQGRRPAIPLRPSTSTPQTFLVATPTVVLTRLGRPSSRSRCRRVNPLLGPDPPGWSRWMH